MIIQIEKVFPLKMRKPPTLFQTLSLAYDQLRVEYEMLTKKVNENNLQSSQGEEIESVRARHRYLSEVLRMTDARDYGIVAPASEFVYKGLEQASYLTGN